MKIARLLIALTLLTCARTALGQTETFDAATFAAPTGWSRTESPGFLSFQASKTQNGRLSNCQIYLFASGASPATPAANFQSEWNVKIVQPLRTPARPNPKIELRPDGWTAFSSFVDLLQNGVPYRTILYTATESGRFMSVVANYTAGACQTEFGNFFQSLRFSTSAPPPQNTTPKSKLAGKTPTTVTGVPFSSMALPTMAGLAAN